MLRFATAGLVLCAALASSRTPAASAAEHTRVSDTPRVEIPTPVGWRVSSKKPAGGTTASAPRNREFRVNLAHAGSGASILVYGVIQPSRAEAATFYADMRSVHPKRITREGVADGLRFYEYRLAGRGRQNVGTNFQNGRVVIGANCLMTTGVPDRQLAAVRAALEHIRKKTQIGAD
jgi:hypothetical protein